MFALVSKIADIRMKSKTVLIVACALLLGDVCVLDTYRPVSERGRDVRINDVSRGLAGAIRFFHDETGHYPRPLSELQLTDDGPRHKQWILDLMAKVEHDGWHDTYDYISTTNGVIIVVTGPQPIPACWFGKRRTTNIFYNIETPAATNTVVH
jgi:hypothetical protein